MIRPPARRTRTSSNTTWRVAIACALAVGLGAIGAAPELRRSLAAAGRAFVDPALVDAPLARATKKAEPAAPHLQLWPEADDDALDLAIAAEFAGAREQDLDGLAGVVLELAPRRLRVPVTRRTVRWVKFFAKNEAGRVAVLDRLQRLARYRTVLEDELRAAGVLEELTAVAAIESGFDPLATSGKGAAGVWQFMPATAKAYGLVIDHGIDERRSLRHATRAAATHLRDLHEHYGRWDLALAAYNAGMGRIDRAVEQYAEYRDPALSGTMPSFDELVRARLLPRETADYVPQITAFAIVAANRKLFGLEPTDDHAPFATAELPVPGGTRLRTIAKAADCTVAEIRELNPELSADRIPVAIAERSVLIPADGLERAQVTFAHYAKDQDVESDDEDLRVADAARRPTPLAALLKLPMDEPRGRAFAPLGRRSSSLGTALQLLPDDAAGAKLALRSAVSTTPDPLAGVDLERLGLGGLRSADDAARGAPTSGRLEEVTKRLLAPGAESDDASIAPTLALRLLPPPPPREPERFAVGGVDVELWREEERPKARFALRALGSRVGVPEVPPGRAGDAVRPAAAEVTPAAASPGGGFTAEVAHVVEAKQDQLDVVASLLRGRLRVLRAERGRQVLAALRREANADRRRTIEAAPYGRAWTTLADHLFPAGHPLEGTLLAARHDPDEVVDAIVLDALRPQREGARLALRVEGDLHRDQVKAVVERALRGLDAPWVDDAPIEGHPREEIVELALRVPDPRLVVGWIAPPEGSREEAATRVAIELLTGKKAGRLRAELVERRELAESVTGRFEAGARASIAAIELAPNGPIGLDVLDGALREELDRLADEGPDPREVAFAVGLLRSRIELERKAAEKGHAGTSWEHTSARVHALLDPGRATRTLATLGRVRADDVRDAARRVLGRGKRVAVVVRPEGMSPAVARGEHLGVHTAARTE